MQHTLVTTLVTCNSVYTYLREPDQLVGELIANTGTFAGQRWLAFTWDLDHIRPGQPIVVYGLRDEGDTPTWEVFMRTSTVVERIDHPAPVCIEHGSQHVDRQMIEVHS